MNLNANNAHVLIVSVVHEKKKNQIKHRRTFDRLFLFVLFIYSQHQKLFFCPKSIKATKVYEFCWCIKIFENINWCQKQLKWRCQCIKEFCSFWRFVNFCSFPLVSINCLLFFFFFDLSCKHNDGLEYSIFQSCKDFHNTIQVESILFCRENCIMICNRMK